MTVPMWTRLIPGNVPVRLRVGVMIFVSCVVSYMLRTNLSINILAMVEPKTEEIDANSSSTTPAPDFGERFSWSDQEVSVLLGAYFWGYLISTLLGGFLANRFGPATVILYTMGLTCVTTLLCPLGAKTGFLYIYVLRFLTGAFAGPLYPALQDLVVQWAPPSEKGKFMSALMGGNFGTLLTWPLVGVIIEAIGWIYGFYIPALVAGVAAVLWCITVSNSPNTHPTISEKERKMIEESLQGRISTTTSTSKRASLPIRSLAQSVPFWCLLFLHYGSLWGMYFLLTAAPKFMNEVLGFNLAKSGFLAALPYLARLLGAFVFGSIGDRVVQSGRLKMTQIRKLFCVFSHVLPGVLLLAICFLAKLNLGPYWYVATITLSLGFNGSSTLTNLQNGQDLAPNFAGTIYSLINFVGTTNGFISPLVVAYFTRNGNTFEQWNGVFLLGSVVYIVPAIVFMCFGSGEVQPWNDPETTAKLDTPKEPTKTLKTVSGDVESQEQNTVTTLRL